MAWPVALALNALLITIFCLQHSLMARAGVKRAIAAVMPEPLERATYVHAANVSGFLVILLWQPVPVVLWDIDSDFLKAVLWIAFGLGWLLLFVAALSIDLLELLGLRQAWAWFNRHQPAQLALKTNWLYRYIEHPMYVGVLLGFWMTPYMTVAHAALAAQLTLYIAIAMSFERRDLRTRFGADYDRWRESQGAPPLPEFVRAIAAELKAAVSASRPGAPDRRNENPACAAALSHTAYQRSDGACERCD